MILLLALALASSVLAQTPATHVSTEVPQTTKPQVLAAYGKLPLSFEVNQGQTDPQVKFLSRGSGYLLFLTPTEAVLTLTKADAHAKRPISGKATAAESEKRAGTVLRMRLVDANPTPRVTGVEEQRGRSNYFIGNDQAKWLTNVPTYAKVKYQGVYPGVDLIYYGTQQQLEYDFVVAPGADPGTIGLSFVGADRLEVDGGGDLVLHTAAGTIRQRKPVIYQEVGGVRQEIPGGYALRETRTVGFKVGTYDAGRPLIIDPALVYSTYLGSQGEGLSIAVDAAGSAYVTGVTFDPEFPITLGAFQTRRNGFAFDAFVTKLDPAGSALVYSTYLGGSGDETGRGIAVDAVGNAYVTGDTFSTDFPTTSGAFRTTPGASGFFHAFVTKLNTTGSTLLYSTYLAGNSVDSGVGIVVDSAGNAYVTGLTASTNFPTTLGAFQTALGGSGGFGDAFVTKLNPGGSALVYSTYLGGLGEDSGSGIAVDAAGNTYVTGFTNSDNFPTTPGALQTTFGGAFGDAFATKLNPAGSALVYSTYLGGSGDDTGHGIAVDAAGSAYLTGSTNSDNFPTTAGAFQPTFVGGISSGEGGAFVESDCFVTKLNPTGSALAYSTFLAGTSSDSGRGIAVDAAGNAYVTGDTFSADFPTTTGALQTTLGGPRDAFVTKVDPTGSALLYSTYLGGSGGESGNGIAVDPSGDAYVTGNTFSTDFPTTAGAFQPTFGGGGGETVFVAKLSLANTPEGANVTVQLGRGVTVTFDNVASAGTTTLTKSDTGPQLPAGFKLGGPPTYYDITTTAVFSGTVLVCIDYTGVSFGNQTALRLFHFEPPNSNPVDVTVSLDTTNRIICGRDTTLSPFAIVEPAEVRFARFTARVEIEKREFEVEGRFTLGAGSNGIQPLTEAVTLQIGAFSATIPAGSFRRHRHDTFRFEGLAGGARLEVKIRSRGRNRFEFEAEGKRAQVGTATPVTVRLTIGDDAGSAIARVEEDD